MICNSPITTITHSSLGSAWLVYILPNEVGAKCSIIGINVLALKSGIPGKQVGTLNIYNPADPSRPVLTWDRDKTRRTGKTGIVFSHMCTYITVYN